MAEVLELYFNTKDGVPNNNGVTFETACLKPVNSQEARLGELYLFAELRNMPVKGPDLLGRILDLLIASFYDLAQSPSSDNFKNALDKANNFLLEIPKTEGLNLGGNFNLAVAAIGPDLTLKVGRIGSAKVFLLRDGQIFNAADNLPAGQNNLFANTVVSQLAESDKILIFNKELLNTLEKEKSLNALASFNQLGEIKRFIHKQKKIFQQTQGACLAILVKKPKNFFWPAIPFASKVNQKIDSVKKIDNNVGFRFLRKILPQSPALDRIILTILISLIVLAILLPMGYFLFACCTIAR